MLVRVNISTPLVRALARLTILTVTIVLLTLERLAVLPIRKKKSN